MLKNRTEWLLRLRYPASLTLAALSGWSVVEFTSFAGGFEPALLIVVRMMLITAIGWAATTLFDLVIKHRISRLDMGRADNLHARKRATRLDVLRRIWLIIGAVATLAAVLTVVPWARQIGVSLFASAGIAGLAIGLAARPVLSNLIAGLQIAFTQPIRLEDAVVVENEWGWIEEIGLFYVVIRVWDWRRLVVPLSYFIEKPFQNWTRQSGSIIGSVFWAVDYRAPVSEMRTQLQTICEKTKLWDGRVVNLQVTETTEKTITIRALASADTSPEAWDLRCFIREEMISWLQAEHPYALPRLRAEAATDDAPDWNAQPSGPPGVATAAPQRDDSLARGGEAGG